MNIFKIWAGWFCSAFLPLYFGGSDSNSTEQTSNNYDNRAITTISSYDLSNRSTNTTNADFSNRAVSNSNNTTSLFDTSSKNSNNTTITLDGGAVAGALGFAGSVSSKALTLADSVTGGALNLAQYSTQQATVNTAHAYDYADQIFSGALDAVNRNDARALNAFERASQMQEAAVGQLQGAYADAKGTSASQQKIILAVLAVAGIFAFTAMGK